MPQGKGTYGSKKGRPPKEARMPRQGKGSKPNPFSAGASTTKKKKLAAMYGDPKKITRGDIITAAKNKKKNKKS